MQRNHLCGLTFLLGHCEGHKQLDMASIGAYHLSQNGSKCFEYKLLMLGLTTKYLLQGARPKVSAWPVKRAKASVRTTMCVATGKHLFFFAENTKKY
jgi:hypothetical protein